MFKSILATTAVLLIGFGSVTAKAQSSEEQILGAIAGGALGSTIGDGDGRKAAMVIGAILGYRHGDRILNPRDRRQFMSMGNNDFRRYCRHEVPYQYSHRRSTHDMWIRGCVDRLSRQQRELEREAYEDGLYGPSH
jgi:uncharacterized protein YcfJ